MMAAAATAALDNALPQLPRVHGLTMQVSNTLESIGYAFALPVQSNMIVLDLDKSGIPPAAFVERCRQHNVAVFGNGRLVFHQQTSEDGVSRLLAALRALMDDKTAGKPLDNGIVSANGCA